MPAHAEVVGVAHSRAPRVSRNRGIMRNSNSSSDYDSAPMCANPSPHMGARPPRTMITGKAHNPGKNQLPAHKGSSLPCATPKIPTPTTLRVEIGPFRHEIGPIQPDQPDVEARTTSSGAKATCRTSELSASSRSAAVRPISTRTTTDLEPELDRSRRGVRPISTRVTTGLEPELDRSRWP